MGQSNLDVRTISHGDAQYNIWVGYSSEIVVLNPQLRSKIIQHYNTDNSERTVILYVL